MCLFYFEIVNMMRQASIAISRFTHSIQQPCGRCDIKSIWQLTALSFRILSNSYQKMWKICWNHLKAAQKKFYQFTIFLYLMREVKMRIVSFSVFQFIFENFYWGTEVYHFRDLIKGTRELTQIWCFGFACLIEDHHH